ncbi:transglutaminase-like cysteine peptidase [Caenibius tardaugens]|nr:transglutaminase-like cysteine peptidase [Caenibius tardaugens]
MMATMTPLAVQIAGATQCTFASGASGLPGALVATAQLSPVNKSAAILGGAPSKLDQIRLQQAAMAAPLASQTPEAAGLIGANAVKPLQPAAGGITARSTDCGTFSSRAGSTASFIQPAVAFRGAAGMAPQVRSPDDYLASKRIAIGRTHFDADWSRVLYQSVSSAQARKFGAGHNADGLALIAAVNRAVNHQIRYVEDRQLFGRNDYWAGAQTTLRMGKGDCEDIALAKMQVLAAAGVARKDMILTIARDLARNADHAILIVRHQGQYLLLDNSTDKVLDASQSYDYRPILSFSEGATWLHGY